MLITGESGTGKSLVARMIHDTGDRKDEPFVELNCGALPEGLLESELFGHAKGSFTGATATRRGRFLAADGGTLFLDEIATASQALQVKLLRVIQERCFEAVGSEETTEVDVRLILATNEDLAQRVEDGTFRRDLYYRISVVPIHIPSLRERRGDIPLLAMHFLHRFAEENAKAVRHIDDNAMTVLQAHSWPGNIRELENAIERGVILCRGDTITPEGPAARADAERVRARARADPPAPEGARDPGARDHRAHAAQPQLEPPGDGARADDQPHDALQQDAQVRPARHPTAARRAARTARLDEPPGRRVSRCVRPGRTGARPPARRSGCRRGAPRPFTASIQTT